MNPPVEIDVEPADQHADKPLPRHKPTAVAVVVFLLGLLLTGLTYWLVNSLQRQQAIRNFEAAATEFAEGLAETMYKQTLLLYSIQALYHSSDFVSRSEFRSFLRSIESEANFTGAAATSWNARVRAQDLSDYEASVRRDTSLDAAGYPDFAVKPGLDGTEGIIVHYIEPLVGNEEAFGFNIYSDPARRVAVDQSRDTGEIVATAPIELAQGLGTGFLMMVPTYDQFDTLSADERGTLFNGLVVGVFHMDRLIAASAKGDFTYLQVADTMASSENALGPLLHSAGEKVSGESSVHATRSILVGGRSWLLSFSQDINTSLAAGQRTRWLVLALGGLASALAALSFSVLYASRFQAQTESRRLTRDLLVANQDLSRSNADLTQFAYVASHDLQTPAGNVLMAVSMLEDQLGEDAEPEVQETFEYLRKSSTRMRSLVTDLLEYAQIGRDSVNYETVDLNAVVAEVRDMTASQRECVGAELQIGELPVVTGDTRQLERLFENLVVNAIKYAVEGRQLRLTIEARAAVASPAGVAAEMVQIVVKDTAQGIEERFHDTVFVPFKRLHRHDDIPGTGLGLSICRQIVERHGGSIVIESSSEQGTTFLISLPGRARA